MPLLCIMFELAWTVNSQLLSKTVLSGRYHIRSYPNSHHLLLAPTAISEMPPSVSASHNRAGLVTIPTPEFILSQIIHPSIGHSPQHRFTQTTSMQKKKKTPRDSQFHHDLSDMVKIAILPHQEFYNLA